MELVPGILEPTTACLNSFVKSQGGVLNIGKRGHLTCAMDYRLHPADTAQSAVRASHDTTSHIPSVPTDIRMERDSHSLIRAAIPLRALQFGIDKGIAENDAGLPAGFSVTVLNSRFEEYVPGIQTMRYYIDIDVNGPMGQRCKVINGWFRDPSCWA